MPAPSTPAAPSDRSAAPRYTTSDIPVSGGVLRVGEWRGQGAAPVVLALHGMAGAHLAWSWLADQLPDARIIAPDLRGRGRSAGLPGPYGIDAHVRDIFAVLDALQLSEVTVIGHSLGAFVAVAALGQRAAAFRHAVLVDGGPPLTVPLTTHPSDLLELVFGRPAAGVDFAFSSLATHRRFWQLHPAFAKDWSTRHGLYADYLAEEQLDDGARIVFRPVASCAAVEADATELSGCVSARERLRAIKGSAVLLTAPRGLANERPGVYSARELDLSASDRFGMPHTEVEGVNHHTIVTSQRGAKAIARAVRRGPAARLDTQAG